jgi:hypothetical protein
LDYKEVGFTWKLSDSVKNEGGLLTGVDGVEMVGRKGGKNRDDGHL